MKIRNAEISDLSALIELAVVLGYAQTESEMLENVTAILADEQDVFLVAVENEKVVGYVQGSPYHTILLPQGMRVMGIAVLPDFQDKKIGGALLTALEVETKKRGFTRVILGSGEQRHLAHDFYRKHGYVGDHKQVKFWKELD